MADDEVTYRYTGMTVWFERDPKEFKTNPFDIASEFGTVNTIGRGNSFDEADVYRVALEDIIEARGYGREMEIAEKALATVRQSRQKAAA